MCRMITFVGTCSRCAGIFTWDDLTQQLSCLEAKNTGIFGQCRRGIQAEEHSFDQECDACVAETEADEGYGGGMEEETEIQIATTKGKGKKKSITDGIEDDQRKKRQRTS